MQVTIMKNPPSPPSLQIAGKELGLVTETELLSLIVQSNLSWDMQVNSMVGKSSRRLYMVNLLKRFGLPVEDLVYVYILYVRPVVEYATPVWHGSLTDKQSKKLESIQKRSCRIILGATYNSYTQALQLASLKTLLTGDSISAPGLLLTALNQRDTLIGSLITTKPTL